MAYLPINTRDEALAEAHDTLAAICTRINQGAVPGAKAPLGGNRPDVLRAIVRRERTQIKIQLSPVLRGTVLPPERLSLADDAADRFGSATMPVASPVDLCGGKTCAALDRQHPRDLFDIMLLLDEDGLTREIVVGFLVYLISHNRPIHELLAPRLTDIRQIFVDQFQGMTREPVQVEALEQAREALLGRLRDRLTPADCAFLVTVKRGEPDWSHLPCDHVRELPGVRWKLRNIRNMKPDTWNRNLAALQRVLAEHYNYEATR